MGPFARRLASINSQLANGRQRGMLKRVCLAQHSLPGHFLPPRPPLVAQGMTISSIRALSEAGARIKRPMVTPVGRERMTLGRQIVRPVAYEGPRNEQHKLRKGVARPCISSSVCFRVPKPFFAVRRTRIKTDWRS